MKYSLAPVFSRAFLFRSEEWVRVGLRAVEERHHVVAPPAIQIDAEDDLAGGASGVEMQAGVFQQLAGAVGVLHEPL